MTPYGSGLHILRIQYQLVSKGFLVCCKFKRKLNCIRIQRIESVRGGGERTKVRRNNKGKQVYFELKYLRMNTYKNKTDCPFTKVSVSRPLILMLKESGEWKEHKSNFFCYKQKLSFIALVYSLSLPHIRIV